tara:strand:- start:286 stop:1302 length:1017 start_codon:yes stop_codon:yes gene_type:complete
MVAGLTSLLSKGIRQVIPKARPKIVDDPIRTNISKVNKNVATKELKNLTDPEINEWQKINEPDPTDPKRYKEVEGHDLVKLRRGVILRGEGRWSQEKYNELVDQLKPINRFSKQDYREMFEKGRIPSRKEIPLALKEDQRTKIKQKKAGVLYDTTGINEGEIIDSRLDIPAYERFNKWITTLLRGKKAKGAGKIYGQTAYLTDVTFIPKTNLAYKVGAGQRNAKGELFSKSPFAVMRGGWKNHDPDTLIPKVEDLIDNPEWVQIGYDPRRHGHFYTREAFNQAGEIIGKETPIESASEVIQVGPLVLARNPKFGTSMLYKQGGSVVERNPYTYNMKAI